MTLRQIVFVAFLLMAAALKLLVGLRRSYPAVFTFRRILLGAFIASLVAVYAFLALDCWANNEHIYGAAMLKMFNVGEELCEYREANGRWPRSPAEAANFPSARAPIVRSWRRDKDQLFGLIFSGRLPASPTSTIRTRSPARTRSSSRSRHRTDSACGRSFGRNGWASGPMEDSLTSAATKERLMIREYGGTMGTSR